VTTEKEAKAQAKAAKAAAKALRPWFKKKRFWLLGVIAVAVFAVVAQSGSDTTTTTTPAAEESSAGAENNEASATEDTVGTGLGSKDASGDIDNVDCGTPDSIGFRYPEVKVTNRSEKTSTYFITLEFESADGSIKYDEAIIIISSLDSGQTMTEKGIITNDIPDGAVCKITEIQRTAD
jgi:hypothetical protein